MKTIAFYIFTLISIQVAAQATEINNEDKRSLIEAGSFFNFSPMKAKQIPGFYVGYWYRYPIDESKTHLEIGGNFNYSTSLYSFNYGKNGTLYPMQSKETIVNLGIRMVKEYPVKNNKIEWVSELSFHTLFLNGKDIPDSEPVKNDNDGISFNVDAESVSSLKFGQGIRFWKNNLGIGIQFSYMPYRLWYKTVVPKGFNTFSIETGLNFKF
ncbi:hypothetical protein C1637_23035 [Chryseobacterium lactis]|uniref:Outer membrane protein beta-barrel domain-containing protein n=1 Tax=Chryseobacterium lactis TaxID=1241981 RepID=A0A3G6RU18_CHRLC|nr:hypothetical protein [Chryseobacterium lactis]AZA80452.1 hypothetical protein EG342_00300 [Chryseobacterium lactis]AZB05454.1 hypothetical protein EG341_16425 [Chryseobacterium lactis]PNW11411.1 hypothetical protein C1637_23035 [Chryseobacterium lactis]